MDGASVSGTVASGEAATATTTDVPVVTLADIEGSP